MSEGNQDSQNNINSAKVNVLMNLYSDLKQLKL